jgi:hypothetical protein
MDLKLTPSSLEVAIPRYFLEEDKKKLDERNDLVEKMLIDTHETAEPEEEVYEDNPKLNIDAEAAIRLI